MREILFKAKQIDNGEWVEGYYLRKYDLLEKEVHFIFQTDKHNTWRCVEIVPETLCQYTGLTDKNGKKIWENDICDRKEIYPEVVKMNTGDWALDYSYVFGEEYGTDFCNLGFYVVRRKCVEVIGNIFDNPKLLKEVLE